MKLNQISLTTKCEKHVTQYKDRINISLRKSTKKLHFWYIMGLKGKFLMQHMAAYIIQIL